ncbi:MAG: rhodanese-like domain-containing protein [Gaiellales bacterium]|nr:MAG: rhodanese-like domain-containing protein [Gaiellales bacterium]
MSDRQRDIQDRPDGREALHERALEVLASTAPEGDFFANAIWGRDFAAAWQRDRAAFFIVDVRDWRDYCLGHIEGALHVDFRDWASPDNLARLPRDRKIIVVCDNGCASAQVSAGLRLLGYDAAIIRTGMSGWSRTRNTGATLEALESAGFPVARAEAEPCAPAPEGVGFGDVNLELFNVIATEVHQRFREVPLEGATARNIIEPAHLRELLESAEGEYFLLDVREDFEYEGVGHIEGARWMDFRAAAVPENLSQLPRDRTIVTICYTGNMAAQLTTVLRLLGYDALVLNLGMAGWVRNPTTRTYLSDIAEAGNPVAELEEHDCGRARGA